ncbi:hypothetical protein DIS24_g1427 [Lasiodiplodia hormozganensis]|uniref:DUF4048 domain-containing protein n=1 Tax=Lasiodiplodia hormozganensis TaxID=869390 RepID=A0AA39Z327_9PEZI|nr:hypothetical protein DIS24_g1427 [Lasiodiplodia hormozganensis]
MFSSSWSTLSRSLVVLGIGVGIVSTVARWRGRRIGFAQISLLMVAGLLSPRAHPQAPPALPPQLSKHHAAEEQLLTELADNMDLLPAARQRPAESVRELPDRDPDLTSSGGPLARAGASSTRPHPNSRGHHYSHSTSSSVSTLSHPPPMPAHARSMSHADATTARQNKRLSLNFPVPVQPASPAHIPSPRRPRPASWVGASPVRHDTFQPSLASPPPDGNFFTALAAQERRVLELRDELAKAEEHLKELKKQWANQEAARKGLKEGYGFHPLHPLNTNMPNLGIIDDDPDGPSWMQKEMERRRAILNGQRSSTRKVFSGSRHTRTLSLLSPDKTAPATSFPRSAERRSDEVTSRALSRTPSRTRSSTTPDITNESEQGEALVRTGKQMASDFKDGLWTFFEDLRQATVGDEAINGVGHQVRRQPSGANIGSSSSTSLSRSKSMGHARKPRSLQPSGDGSALIDIETDFWKEHGIEAPKPAVVKPARSNTTPQKPQNRSSQTFEESWEDWESPNNDDKFVPGHSSTNSSVSEGQASHCSDGSSPRTSTSSGPVLAPLDLGKVRETKRSSTSPSSPWHALSKLSPSNVKRAASNFMDEWEKSITSPTEGSMAEADALQEYIASMTPPKTSKAE